MSDKHLPPRAVVSRLEYLAPEIASAAQSGNMAALYRLITVAVPRLKSIRAWSEDIPLERIETWEVEALTNREWSIVRGIASGMGNRQIAARLRITQRTVETHVSTILGKLQLENRTQLAAWYYQNHAHVSEHRPA